MNNKNIIYILFIITMIIGMSTFANAIVNVVYDQNSPNYDTDLGYMYEITCVDTATCDKIIAYDYMNTAQNTKHMLYSSDSGSTWTNYNVSAVIGNGFWGNGYNQIVDENGNFIILDRVGSSTETHFFLFNTTSNELSYFGNASNGMSGLQYDYIVGKQGTTGTWYVFDANAGSVPYVTTDNGQSFTTLTQTGYTTSGHNRVECNENDCSIMFACADTDSQISTDSGATWNNISVTGTGCYDVDVSPSGQYIIFGDGGTNKVYYSLDYGNTWNNYTSILSDINAVGINDNGQMFYWAFGFSSIVEFGYSNDYGSNWNIETFNNYEAMFGSGTLSDTGVAYFGGANYSGLAGYEITVLSAQIPTPASPSICQEYSTSNSVINFTQDESFNSGTSGVEYLGGTSNTGAFGTSYYTCIRILNADNVTIEGNGYTLSGNNEVSFPYDLGIYISNVTNLHVNNLKMKDMYYGVMGVEENYGGIGRSCYNQNLYFDTMEFTNVKYAGIRTGCNTNTLAVPNGNGLYASNINVYNSTNLNSVGFFDYRNFDEVHFTNVYAENLSKTTGTLYQFYFNNMIGFSVDGLTNVESNMPVYRINNASNGYLNNYNGVNSGFRFIPSAGSNNLTLSNVYLDGYVLPSGQSQANQNMFWIGSGVSGSVGVYVSNVYVKGVITDGSFFTSSTGLTTNNDEIYFTNITVEDSSYESGGGFGFPFFNAVIKNTYINIDGFTTRNVTTKDRMFALDGVNFVFTGLDIDWKYIASGHTISTAICISCTTDGFFASLQLTNSIIHTPQQANNVYSYPDNDYFAQWFVSEANNPFGQPYVSFAGVTAFDDYVYGNRTYQIDTYGADITPFHITDDGVNKIRIFGLPSTNKGWFPRLLTNDTIPFYNTTQSELNGGSFETSWDDIALWNQTTGFVLNDSAVPNTLAPSIFYTNYFYTEYAPPCAESWVANDTVCNGVNYTIQYYDAVMCGTFNDLPLDNGLIVDCSNSSSDIIAQTNNSLINILTILIVVTVVLAFIGALLLKFGILGDSMIPLYIMGVVIVVLTIIILIIAFNVITTI